jgi:apolipoprotein N-acyltransferase
MKNKKDVLRKTGWLLLALVLLFFSGGDRPVWVAVWLAPVFILRFFRETGALKAFLVALPFMVAVDLIADAGMTPFPSFKILLFYTSYGMVLGLLPYVLDSLLKRSLPYGLGTLLFPSLAVSLPFILGSHGSWGAKANGMDDLALLQIVSVTGISGIAFLVYWTAAVANEIWEQRGNRKVVKSMIAVFLIVGVAVYGFGLIRLRRDYLPQKSMLAAGLVSDPSLRDELIHAFTALVRNDPEKQSDIAGIRDSMNTRFRKLLDDSVALADSGLDIALWYEGAVVLFEEDERAMIELASERARENQIYLGVSAAVYQNRSRSDRPGIQPIFKNKLILISPGGEVEWEYSKGILVPGMEAAISIPGDRIMKVSGSAERISGAICYELDFPRHIRQAAKLKAGLILGPSNDWEAIKNTHARMARLRAIENGISLLRPANGGISIAVDPYGRILSQVDNYTSQGAPLIAPIPTDPVPTVYSVMGDYFNWLCLILSLTCLTLGVIFRFKQAVPGGFTEAAGPSGTGSPPLGEIP